MMTAIIVVLALAGWCRVTGIETAGTVALPLLTTFVIFSAAAIQEEIILRGIVFHLLENATGSWIALIISSLLFGLSHLITPHRTLIGALAIAATGGLVSADVYMLTRNLWSVFGPHWAWNLFEGPIFGTAVSGRGTIVIALCDLWTCYVDRRKLWTGGWPGHYPHWWRCGSGSAAFVVHRRRILIPSWLHRAQPIPSAS